jgi:hypothetical protein
MKELPVAAPINIELSRNLGDRCHRVERHVLPSGGHEIPPLAVHVVGGHHRGEQQAIRTREHLAK